MKSFLLALNLLFLTPSLFAERVPFFACNVFMLESTSELIGASVSSETHVVRKNSEISQEWTVLVDELSRDNPKPELWGKALVYKFTQDYTLNSGYFKMTIALLRKMKKAKHGGGVIYAIDSEPRIVVPETVYFSANEEDYAKNKDQRIQTPYGEIFVNCEHH